MKKTIAIIFLFTFSISLCMAQNIQSTTARQQIDRRYQSAIESAQKNFSQRQYSQAKRDYLTARELKPENAAFINQIIAGIDKLLAVEAKQGGSEIQNIGSAPSSPASTYQGIVVPGATLNAKLDWLVRSAESHNTYIVIVNADENIAPRTLQYRGAIDITIVLRGDRPGRTLRLSSHGTMFTINTDVTFILDGNITLHGHNGNTGSMVYVDGGHLRMNAGTTITGNVKTDRYNGGAGVLVAGGAFEMTGGTISGNTANANGGGIQVGGIMGYRDPTFNMTGGTISDNTANESGGGIYAGGGNFKMTAGTISGNTAQTGGGVGGYNFTMYGGTISSNTASEYGGGIYSKGGFTKTGGTITGYNSSQSNGNVVKDGSGVLARRGHAVYYNRGWVTMTIGGGEVKQFCRKETTAGTGVNLSSDSPNNWDE